MKVHSQSRTNSLVALGWPNHLQTMKEVGEAKGMGLQEWISLGRVTLSFMGETQNSNEQVFSIRNEWQYLETYLVVTIRCGMQRLLESNG